MDGDSICQTLNVFSFNLSVMDLFPHNREAYDSAVKLFKKVNRVCIIRPTGTGKSVIIAEFVNQNPSRRHLLLAPGAHIFNEIRKHLRRGEISFSTYIGLKENDGIFRRNSFDYIYLDEFHRLGAEVWGSCVDRLLKLNPAAKVLGTSATHIRYLDDNRNMASEIFNDCIATQMSLNSAIVNGILPAPKYISALYSVQEEFLEVKRKILSSNRKNKETLVRDLDSKVIDWERSSGLDRVIKKHLSAERRRVIVFCKDWEHLKYARKILAPIFREIYGHVESRSLYSGKRDSENDHSLKLFTGEDQSAIILYTIDKVNEGLHSKNCNTVILLRDTISPIIFYQQIGRAFSIRAANRPLIIDLVNNFKNIQLASFKSDFEHELNASTDGNLASIDEKMKAAIEFVDEIQDIRQIFLSFDEEVDVWKSFYNKAKAYFKEHGHLYVSPADRELLNWVRSQRRTYQKRKMGKEREAQLRAIGMDFDQEIDARWMTMSYELEEWKKKNGKLPGFQEDGRLYYWMIRNRQEFRRGTLSSEQINILQKLIRLEDSTWLQDRVERLVKHFKNGNGAVTDETIKHDLLRIKELRRLKRLSKETLIELRNANVPIDGSVNHYLWFEKVKTVLTEYKKNGVPPKTKTSLYHFCIKERRYLKERHPSAKFIECNKEAKLAYDSFKKIIVTMAKPAWDDQYAELKRIAKEFGSISSTHCEQNLQEWMWRQRRFIRDGKLPLEQIKKLLTIKEIDWYDHSRNRKN
jgi:hypothetical protein